MDLRPPLAAPAVPESRVERLCAAISHIEDLLEEGDAAEAIAAFNADTGHAYEPYDFRNYYASRDIEDLALEAARPARPKVPDISRAELVEIVRRMRVVGRDQDYYMLVLETNTVRPGAAALALGDEPAEAVVDEILRYRPIAL
ncbi:hypothetical protein ABT369_48245 [Dactylosporangium sp. NPDC000244]|uniref:hypothetical protein n=1 Tax=Dactylosporangium sp. NPDC000244 TaxID=3154365 RepID=UPI00332C72E3